MYHLHALKQLSELGMAGWSQTSLYPVRIPFDACDPYSNYKAVIWILDFHFKIVLVLRRRYLTPIRCNNGKRKMWPWRWLHHFDFQHRRWLHYFGRVIFYTHTADPLLIGCMIVVKCDTCKISGAYGHLDCITSTVGDIGNRQSMQVTHSYKKRIFHLFPPQLKK